MTEFVHQGLSRRAALRTAAAAAAGAAVSQIPRVARAHDLRPTDPLYQFDEYERVVNRDVTVRQVFEWPNINNPIIFGNVSNSLNGFHFSYDVPARPDAGCRGGVCVGESRHVR